MLLQISYPPSSRPAILGSMAAEATTERRETEETARCEGKRTGHVPSETMVTREFGDMDGGADEVWGPLAEGRVLTLRCAECRVPLRVDLRVRVN